jgi:hypothetical protein
VLVLACAAYWPVLSLDHLGWDTWPLLLTSRIASVGDLAGSFTEKLMDGRYPHGDFYRPVLSLSIALDRAIWGTRAFGFHLTDLLLLLLTTVAVYALGRRLLGDAWAALAACALFALHPLHFESLPATARRADALANLFTLLALLRLPARGGGRGVCAGLLALLAVGSKESGVLAAPLLAVLAMVEGEGDRLQRVRAALRAAAPALALVALFLGARALVLGGMGGHPGTSLVSGVLRAPGLVLLFVPTLLVPQPVGGAQALAGLALALLLVVASFVFTVRSPRAVRSLWVSGSWGGALLILSGVSGDQAPWYASALLPAYVLMFGALVAGVRTGWDRAPKPAQLAGAAVALLLAFAPLRYSGLFERYPQWERLSSESSVFLADLRERIAVAEPGGPVLRVFGLPQRAPRRRPVGIYGAGGLAPYSVQAWVEIELPGRRVRVLARDPVQIAHDEIVVVLVGAEP